MTGRSMPRSFTTTRLGTAEQVYRASLAAAPDFVWGLAGLARARAAQGDVNEAVRLYQQAVDAIPLPEFVIALGEAQEAAGRTEEAEQTYEVVRAIQKRVRDQRRQC